MLKLILLSVHFLFCLNLSQAQTSVNGQTATTPLTTGAKSVIPVPAAVTAKPGETPEKVDANAGKYEEFQSICRKNEYENAYYLSDEIKDKRIKLLQDKIASGNDVNRMTIRLLKEYIDQKKVKLANDTYAVVKKLALTDADNNLVDGYIAFMQRKLKQSEVLIEKVVKLEPKNVEVAKFLAEVFSEQNNYFEAAQIFQDLNKQFGKGYYASLCEALILDSHHADGEKACSKALLEDSANPYPSIFLGISSREKENPDLAIMYFTDSLKAKKTEMGYTCLGEILSMENRFEAAIQNYQKSLEIAPKSTRALSGLAWAELKNKNMDKALLDFKKLCQTDRKLVYEMRKAYQALNAQNSVYAKKFAEEIQNCNQPLF